MNSLIRLVGIGLLALLAASPLACTTYNVSVITSPSDDAEEARQLFLQVNLPTVMVRAESGLGSGVVYGDGTLVLTAAHVVSTREYSQDDQGNLVPGDLIVEKCVVFKNEGIVPFLAGATVIKIDPDLDLAILKLAQVYPYAKATFAKEDPYLYQKCWASGHPHGVTDPLISEGRVQDLWADGFILYSSPTTFGNSGGPVFILVGKTYQVSAVVQRVYTEGLGTAVNHMGLGCLPSEVRKFVE